jgi:hypothetical protein
MNIGFYGHSNCSSRSSESFIDIIANKLNANVVNTGVRQGSEERILYELKKTKNLDIAVIFHSEPHYIFLPNCDRDISLKRLKEEKIDLLFNNYSLIKQPKFVNVFQTKENFERFIKDYEYYLYDPDLHLNRFYGALLQIDQYITSKKIPTIHVVNKNSLPSWFKFTSGRLDTISRSIIKNHISENPSAEYNNGITKEGNIELANRLLDLIAACSR